MLSHCARISYIEGYLVLYDFEYSFYTFIRYCLPWSQIYDDVSIGFKTVIGCSVGQSCLLGRVVSFTQKTQ